jgi:hypothetical protein
LRDAASIAKGVVDEGLIVAAMGLANLVAELIDHSRGQNWAGATISGIIQKAVLPRSGLTG